MAILNNNPLVGASGNQGGYNINNSLRFRSSASAYLNRTPASAGSQTTWTWSGWIKRGQLGAQQKIFTAGSTGTLFASFEFISGDTFQFYAYNGATNAYLVTTQVFRDPSAWYHIVFVCDTTNATSSNRLKLYVNGVQVTSFSTATYPTQNFAFPINNNVIHNIARDNINATNYLDGYLTETRFIDGQALTPSSFGETDTTTGVWKPKAYTGTYGTNGFYLKFSDIATTSGSNAGLGKDFSGNSNYWTTNNISVTSGTTYDAMTDSPTNTSATVANYATLNPVLQNGWWAAVNRGTISNGNLTHVSGGNTTAFGNFDFVSNSGKWYYEVTCGATDSNNTIVIAAQSRSTFEVGYYQSGLKQINGATPTSYGSSWTSGDVIGVAIDVPNNTITFYKNNVSQGAISNTFPTGQPVYGGSYYNSTSGDYNYNFGQRPFSYTPPSGYVAMNTYNLSTPTILQGNKYMDATLYTGNGSTQTIVNQGQFKPDFVWVKRRDGAGQDHVLQDSNRGFSGTTKLASSSTAAENTTGGATGSEWGSVTAANSNGFSITASTNGDQVNKNTWTYVGWQWQAGQGSTSSNTSGSITSTVSVNTTAGFSVVTWTGNGTIGATVGHGLGVTPSMIIVKQRNGTEAWPVYHISTGATKYTDLSNTAATATSITRWNNTAPSSTVITLYNDAATNGSSSTYVAYCWAAIAGYSSFGSYTGNGSADGSLIYTGFKPKFIMIKCTDTAGTAWVTYDTARDTYNVAGNILLPNSSSAELSGYSLDILSNGFKHRQGGGDPNASGRNYIYACWASNPFKSSNAV